MPKLLKSCGYFRQTIAISTLFCTKKKKKFKLIKIIQLLQHRNNPVAILESMSHSIG